MRSPTKVSRIIAGLGNRTYELMPPTMGLAELASVAIIPLTRLLRTVDGSIKSPSLDTTLRIANALGVTINELLYGVQKGDADRVVWSGECECPGSKPILGKSALPVIDLCLSGERSVSCELLVGNNCTLDPSTTVGCFQLNKRSRA